MGQLGLILADESPGFGIPWLQLLPPVLIWPKFTFKRLERILLIWMEMQEQKECSAPVCT